LTSPAFELHFPEEPRAVQDEPVFHPEPTNPVWQAVQSGYMNESIALAPLNLRSQGQYHMRFWFQLAEIQLFQRSKVLCSALFDMKEQEEQ
jgi:hypothetical protein